MRARIENAQKFTKDNKDSVNKRYRHNYHLQPEVGWMNDPNGFSYFNGEYHLYYQHYPYKNSPGIMHWAHVTSKNLVKWSQPTIAMVPSEDYDKNGVFSGTAIQVGEELWLYYTGHSETKLDRMFDDQLYPIKQNIEAPIDLELPKEGDLKRETQCLAFSKDGINFEKYSENPIIGTDGVPEGASVEDIRDPKVWKHKGIYYMVLGGRSHEKIGKVLFYRSLDGIQWEYVNELSLGIEFGSVYECPDLFHLPNVDVLIMSPQDAYRQGNQFENIHASMALIGKFNYETCEFEIEKIQELDGGFDFYAPQTMEDPSGRRIMIGWMNMWERLNYLDVNDHGWNGAMTFPRELTYTQGHLYQMPIREIENYYKEKIEIKNIELNENESCLIETSKSAVLTMDYEFLSQGELRIKLFGSSTESMDLVIDHKQDQVRLERWRTKHLQESKNNSFDYVRTCTLPTAGKRSLRILIDVSSVEVFFDNGQVVMTSLFFPEYEDNQVVISGDCDVSVSNIVVNNIQKQ